MSNQNNNNAKIATIGRKVESEKIDYLLDKFFEIPAYQRLYEWESIHIETLLDDMKKAWNNKKEQYFIGNITTSIDKNDNNKFILIDGQQRLTTLWFIGFYLASKGCDEWKEFITQDEKVRIAMSIRDNEENALKELAMKIQNDTIKPNENSEINLYTYLPSDIHQKIINAFECIEKWFNAMFGKYANGKLEIDLKQLKCFSLFIYIRVCFVFVELAENTDLNRFFVRMNNRGKQLEKHEILKARILSVIQQGGGEWQKYAKIWDLCSDMNKYIFQSANDRKVLNAMSDDNEWWNIDRIIKKFNNKNTKNKDSDDTLDKVESIIDFPTFLLHCYKLFIVDKLLWNEKGKYPENEILEILKKITITKDNLLEIMWDNQTNKGKNKEVILDDKFIFNDENGQAKANCKDFIESMLRYRVLFDYFVIKNNAEQGHSFRIRRLYPYASGKNKTTYYHLPEDNKSAMDSPLHNLAMIQNYLRVARSGDRQNYHHWLTPFLSYLDTLNALKYLKSDLKTKILVLQDFCIETKNDEKIEQKMMNFLENLDTKLAIKQLSKTNENILLNTTNIILINTNEHSNFQKEKSKIEQISKWQQKYNIFFKKKCFLNNSTGTPHYWFYRLEYYLWKNGVENEEKLEIRGKSFDKIRKNFYFRNLGSVEHFQPQSEPNEKWWLNDKSEMDTFGNLALISRSLNSSLGKQNLDKKEIDIAKEGNSESLKLVLMCCLKNLKNNSSKANEEISKAQEHQKQMITILIKSLKDSQGN